MTKHHDVTLDTGFTQSEYSILRGGLVYQLLKKMGLSESGMRGVRTRMFGFTVITFAPILILASLQGVALPGLVKLPLIYDFSEIVRFFLTGPLLIVSEAWIEPWLAQVILYLKNRLIDQDDAPEFAKILEGALKLRDSYFVEIALILFTFGWMQFEDRTFVSTISTWHFLPSGEPTWAAQYFAYFAKPLSRFLWIRWLWRYVIWSGFLLRVSRLNLKVMPTHPDRLGGLAFIGTGHSKFCLLAFTFGVQAAALLGEQIIFDSKPLSSFKYEIFGLVMIMLTLFLTPLLAFTARLIDAKRLGLFEYSSLADEYTSAFRKKWIEGEGREDQVLGTGDIQSLADLGNSYNVVADMRTSLIGKDNILAFGMATLLPFGPLLLTVYPFDELIKNLLKALV